VAGKGNKRGTPQGGVVSPLLANINMNRFLKHRRLTGRGEAFRAHVVSYAGDFVILNRGFAAEALSWTKAVVTRLLDSADSRATRGCSLAAYFTARLPMISSGAVTITKLSRNLAFTAMLLDRKVHGLRVDFPWAPGPRWQAL
jgi:hypothetical protein